VTWLAAPSDPVHGALVIIAAACVLGIGLGALALDLVARGEKVAPARDAAR
jgi:hypothetical protein